MLWQEKLLLRKKIKFSQNMFSLVVILYVPCLWVSIVHTHYEVNLIFFLCFQFPAFPSITPPDCHPRRHSHEDQGSRSHLSMRYHRKCSVDGSFKEPVGSQRGAHSKIQEFSESFEQHLCLQTKHPPSSVGGRTGLSLFKP